MKSLKKSIKPLHAHVIRLILSGFIPNFLTAWLLVGSTLLFSGIGNDVFTPDFMHDTSIIGIFTAIAVIMLIMMIIDLKIHKALSGAYALPFAVVLLSININTFTAERVDDKLLIALSIFLAISVYYAYRCGCCFNANLPSKKTLASIIILSIIFTAVLVLISCLRYYSFSTPNYDFGIFVNMYHNMKESFSPVTTCERDKLLSHFAVHVSPIYYILLPFYYIFPSPYTLQIAQALLIYSGVIPLCLIMKKYGISNRIMLLFSLVFLCYPAFACGCFYDFHENCFLVPLLLWLFFFFEKDKTLLTVLFAVLTCAVKEDATVYVAIFAIYAIISRKKYKKGALLLAIAVLIFVADCVYLKYGGEGIMSGRFSGLIYDDDGLFGVIKTIARNPSYFLSVLLSTNDEDSGKLIYLMNLLLPLAFLPFYSKKISRYILIAPIFINLMASYYYQYNIGFQYHFGISAFLFYITLLNIADVEKTPTSQRKLRSVLIFAVLMSVIMYTVKVMPTFNRELNKALANGDEYSQMNDILDTIPEDAGVICSTFLLPHLADREVIYEVHYHDMSTVLTEYLILDMRPAYAEGALKFATNYSNVGYELVKEYPNLISIYRYSGYTEAVN